MATACVLTIGNELVSGDVPNTNASWIAKRLAPLGVETRLIAAVPDEVETIAEFIRREAPLVDFLVVTGGLGGTPDDLTREAISHAFDVPQEEIPELAADLRARFARDPDYAARWAQLPRGSRSLGNPLGGAPGFVIENVYVVPGLPAEYHASLWGKSFPTAHAAIEALTASLRPGATIAVMPEGPYVLARAA